MPEHCITFIVSNSKRRNHQQASCMTHHCELRPCKYRHAMHVHRMHANHAAHARQLRHSLRPCQHQAASWPPSVGDQYPQHASTAHSASCVTCAWPRMTCMWRRRTWALPWRSCGAPPRSASECTMLQPYMHDEWGRTTSLVVPSEYTRVTTGANESFTTGRFTTYCNSSLLITADHNKPCNRKLPLEWCSDVSLLGPYCPCY